LPIALSVLSILFSFLFWPFYCLPCLSFSPFCFAHCIVCPVYPFLLFVLTIGLSVLSILFSFLFWPLYCLSCLSFSSFCFDHCIVCPVYPITASDYPFDIFILFVPLLQIWGKLLAPSGYMQSSLNA
jgi:hypothetical protein